MAKTNLRAEMRPVNTKHTVKEIREKGYIPGVIYGKKIGNVPIRVAERDLTKMGGSHVVEIALPQGSFPAVVREVQKHPVSGAIRHVDFMQVDMDQKIKAQTGIQVVGTPLGVKQGGILQLGERSVEIEALPGELPDYLEADVSFLEIGDKYTVADLQKATPLKIISELDSVIAVVAAPRQAETVEEAKEDREVSEERNEALEGDGEE